MTGERTPKQGAPGPEAAGPGQQARGRGRPGWAGEGWGGPEPSAGRTGAGGALTRRCPARSWRASRTWRPHHRKDTPPCRTAWPCRPLPLLQHRDTPIPSRAPPLPSRAAGHRHRPARPPGTCSPATAAAMLSLLVALSGCSAGLFLPLPPAALPLPRLAPRPAVSHPRVCPCRSILKEAAPCTPLSPTSLHTAQRTEQPLVLGALKCVTMSSACLRPSGI